MAAFVYNTDPALLEVTYGDWGDSVTVRKADMAEGAEGDISGVYFTYPDVQTIAHDERTIELRGENDQVYLAIWEDQGYVFSVYADAGVSQETMLEITDQVL